MLSFLHSTIHYCSSPLFFLLFFHGNNPFFSLPFFSLSNSLYNTFFDNLLFNFLLFPKCNFFLRRHPLLCFPFFSFFPFSVSFSFLSFFFFFVNFFVFVFSFLFTVSALSSCLLNSAFLHFFLITYFAVLINLHFYQFIVSPLVIFLSFSIFPISF